jgi:hypothetical protein
MLVDQDVSLKIYWYVRQLQSIDTNAVRLEPSEIN